MAALPNLTLSTRDTPYNGVLHSVSDEGGNDIVNFAIQPYKYILMGGGFFDPRTGQDAVPPDTTGIRIDRFSKPDLLDAAIRKIQNRFKQTIYHVSNDSNCALRTKAGFSMVQMNTRPQGTTYGSIWYLFYKQYQE